MPRKRRHGLPLHVDSNPSKGHVYYYFRRGHGPRIPLPDDPKSEAFWTAYAEALNGTAAGEVNVEGPKRDKAGTIGALIASYLDSDGFKSLRDSSKTGYMSRLNTMRVDHGHRAVAGLNQDRINDFILKPLSDRPGAKLDTLKKLRILINHAVEKGLLKHDPSLGIKRPKGGEIRAWTDAEMAAFEKRWPIGTKQRTAYALMLNMGTARADTHLLTWKQVDNGEASYTRKKTNIDVVMRVTEHLEQALAASPRKNVVVITTEFGKPFTVDGFSGFMRDSISRAGIDDLTCQPHGLRKTLGRLMADADCSAHDIMAMLGHTTLAQAEKYTREANRRRGAKRAVAKLDEHRKNKASQTASKSLGKIAKTSLISDG
jgi:enterobacteria phage integrase